MTASDAEAAKLPEGIVSLLCRVIEPGLAQHGDYDFVMGIPSSLSTIYFGNDFVKPRLSSRIVANVADELLAASDAKKRARNRPAPAFAVVG